MSRDRATWSRASRLLPQLRVVLATSVADAEHSGIHGTPEAGLWQALAEGARGARSGPANEHALSIVLAEVVAELARAVPLALLLAQVEGGSAAERYAH